MSKIKGIIEELTRQDSGIVRLRISVFFSEEKPEEKPEKVFIRADSFELNLDLEKKDFEALGEAKKAMAIFRTTTLPRMFSPENKRKWYIGALLDKIATKLLKSSILSPQTLD